MMRIDAAARALLRLPASAARAVREQTDREQLARIDATIARLEGDLPDLGYELMCGQAARRVRNADPDDPLERLWKLEAWRPVGGK